MVLEIREKSPCSQCHIYGGSAERGWLRLVFAMRGSIATLHSADYSLVRAELIAMRVRAGLTQRGLATKLHLPHQWVGRSELGERRLDILETMAWCHACGEDAAEFVARFQKKFGVPYVFPQATTK